MTNRGYTLLDFSIPQLIGNDLDRIVGFLEYVRTHFHELVPCIPSSCELDLIAGETAHNSGPFPLLVLFVPEADINSLPHPFAMIDTLGLECGTVDHGSRINYR